MQTELKILSHHDIDEFIELINVFAEVFEMENFSKTDKNYLQRILSKPDFLVLIVKSNNKVVGGLTVYLLDQYYSTKPLAYIYDLGILKEFQHQGIGKMLVGNLIHHCKEKGFEEVFVQTHKTDKHAAEFYRSTNATQEEEVIHFSYLV
jgi:aminoglycoside 3-N-acetyltransferase I